MKKTHGQKRKGRVTAIVAIIFIGLTATGVHFYQTIMGNAYEWVETHAETQGTVTAKSFEEDEYRNRKGRKRTTTYYYMDVTFEVDGEEIIYYSEPNASEYNAKNEGDKISVWYDPEDPYYNHALKSEVENGGKTAVSSALMAVAPFTGGFSWFLYSLLMMVFGRESRKKLADGFYTDSSWLDVDDNKLVLATKDLLLVAKFEDTAQRSITEAYQNGASHKELLAMFKAKQIQSIPVSKVTLITSRHDNDTIQVEDGENDINLDFLNIGTKAHALEKITETIGHRFEHVITKRSRLRSAAPRLAVTAALLGIGFFLNNIVAWLPIALLIFFVAPRILLRVMSPTVLTEFKAVENVKTEVSNQEDFPPKAA